MRHALAAVALLAACDGGGGGGGEMARPAPASKPDPRLTAVFDIIAREALASAERARRTRGGPQDVRVDSIDLQRAGVAVLDSRDHRIDLSPAGPRIIELRYQRGMRDYPGDLVDPQAEAARRAIEDCLAEDDDLARSFDRLGIVTMTVRIDHATAPASVRLVGGRGLDGCVARQLRVLPADGVFLAVIRVSR